MIVAVIPVKRLSEAKSRLSPRLSPRERATLVETILRRTVDVLKEVGAIDRIAVATEERTLIDSLSSVEWLPDMGGLNPSLVHAASWAADLKARSMLVLPCDLPLLEGRDIRALLDSGHAEPGVSIAPTQDGGTGAILLSPPEVIAPAFGPDSFMRHIENARARDLPVRTVIRRGFSHDLDTADDLACLEAHTPNIRYLTT